MTYMHRNQGTCSRSVRFDIDENGLLHNIQFEGGCNGNLQGISKLCEGKDAKEIMQTLRGTRCGFKNTSCPDQLAIAIAEAIEKE